MPVYLVAAAEALGYLAAVPVCVVVCLSSRDGLRLGAGVSAFQSRGARRRALRGMRRPKPRRKSNTGALRRVMAIVRRTRLLRLSLRGRLGLGDAAATALACGGLTALGATLRGRADSLELDIAPAFGDAVQVELRGMICARAGQIIVAAARGGANHLFGRIAHGKAPD